jgi:hypothetical protein
MDVRPPSRLEWAGYRYTTNGSDASGAASVAAGLVVSAARPSASGSIRPWARPCLRLLYSVDSEIPFSSASDRIERLCGGSAFLNMAALRSDEYRIAPPVSPHCLTGKLDGHHNYPETRGRGSPETLFPALPQNSWASRPPAARLLRHPWGVKLLPPASRGKAGMGVGTRSEALDPHPNLPPERGKEPDRALETCGSVAKPTLENVPR